MVLFSFVWKNTRPIGFIVLQAANSKKKTNPKWDERQAETREEEKIVQKHSKVSTPEPWKHWNFFHCLWKRVLFIYFLFLLLFFVQYFLCKPNRFRVSNFNTKTAQVTTKENTVDCCLWPPPHSKRPLMKMLLCRGIHGQKRYFCGRACNENRKNSQSFCLQKCTRK